MNWNPYLRKKEEFKVNWALDYGTNNIERLTLLVLLCNLTQSIRKSTPDVSVTDVIDKIVSTNEGALAEEFYTRVALWCDSLLGGDQLDFPDFGFKTTKAKVEEIKRINNNILPF